MIFQGRGAVITGGGRGIGAAVARELAENGAKVGVSARSMNEVEAVAQELTAVGHIAHAIKCDVADENSVEMMAK